MVKKVVKVILCIVIFRGLILACIDLSMVWKAESPLSFEEISIMFQLTVHAVFSICLGEILYIVMYPPNLKKIQIIHNVLFAIQFLLGSVLLISHFIVFGHNNDYPILYELIIYPDFLFSVLFICISLFYFYNYYNQKKRKKEI